MRKVITVATGALLLAACGDGSSGGSGAGNLVLGSPTPTATPTPTPTPTATPTPIPMPTASSSYQRYADLTGDRSFQTACASMVLGNGLPTPQPAAAFGEALTLGFAAGTGGWSVTGDGVALSFAGNEAVSAPTGQRIYEHVVAGSVQRLTIAEPVASGMTLNYTRNLLLRADRSAGTTLYSCVFGVPSLVADVPSTSVGYGKVTVNGTAYMTAANGTVQTYVLSGSTGTASYDATSKGMVLRLHLVGYLQTGSTLATTSVDLGTFTGNGAVDGGRVRFAGSLDGVDRISLFSSFTGAFFGGVETGAAFEILASDTNTGNRIAAVGTLAAAQ